MTRPFSVWSYLGLAAFSAALALSMPAFAQETVEEPGDSADDPGQGPEMPEGPQPDKGTARGRMADLRALDKITGHTSELKVPIGERTRYGTLDITVGDCRRPVDNPESDAFAQLIITEADGGKVDFAGWMIASSPALSALDHPRYDIWVIGCTRAVEGR